MTKYNQDTLGRVVAEAHLVAEQADAGMLNDEQVAARMLALVRVGERIAPRQPEGNTSPTREVMKNG